MKASDDFANRGKDWKRRDVIKTGLAAATFDGVILPGNADAKRSSIVADENAKTGAADWRLDRVEKDTSPIEGYDASYCSNSDLLAPERGLKRKGFLSVGHDEYWDLRQFYSLEKMREAGVSLLLEKIYTATVYPGPRDDFVWNAASIFWSQGLASPPGHVLPTPKRKPIFGPDERVEKMTRNLIERAIS